MVPSCSMDDVGASPDDSLVEIYGIVYRQAVHSRPGYVGLSLGTSLVEIYDIVLTRWFTVVLDVLVES